MTDLAERRSANFCSLRQAPATDVAQADSPHPVPQWSRGLASLRILLRREPLLELQFAHCGGSTESYPGRNIQRPLLLPGRERPLPRTRATLERAVLLVASAVSISSAQLPPTEVPACDRWPGAGRFWSGNHASDSPARLDLAAGVLDFPAPHSRQ